ncbi:MAG: hypothetical protein J0I79_13505 [Mesorhizobium sp.]|uniref:hypothetical protein n=1 Tax=Mesorhizobium sp. TaxID=1871066 RepID=UPI001AC8C21A|nr:hypothetical protein [Mesorhizobium sp.]MBN9218965.1 hypothetical protein [Mesorhizobium sp.]
MRSATTILFVLSVVSSVFAGEISEPTTGVKLTYSDDLWQAEFQDQKIFLSCMADACGGDCSVVSTTTPTGLDSHEFFERYRNEINDETIARGVTYGFDPIAIDKPSLVKIDGRDVSLSSVRLRKPGLIRNWTAVSEAPFGVVTLICYTTEDTYEIARKTWLKLAKGIALPEK